MSSLEVSASNAITFASYILVAADVESTTWKLRGVAIAGAVFSVGIHIVAPKLGRWLQDGLSAVKLFTLFFIVCCGFAALGGHLRIDKPHNFSNAFEGTSNSGYNIGTAILNVIFSFQGYDNVNAVSLSTQLTSSAVLITLRSCQKFIIHAKPSRLPYLLPWLQLLCSTSWQTLHTYVLYSFNP